MRKTVLLIAAAVLAVAVVAAQVAFAATTKSTVKGSIKPTKVGTIAKPKNTSLFVEVATKNSDGSQPPLVKKTVITLGKEVDANGERFPACSKATLDNQGPTACPKGSKVGSGTTDAQIGTNTIRNIAVQAFNGPAGKKLLLYVGSGGGVNINKAIEGTVSGGNGKPLKTTFPVEKALREPAPCVFASLTRFNTTLFGTARVRGKTYGYIETRGCAGGKIALSALFTYATTADHPNLPENLKPASPTQNAVNTIKCST